SPNTRRPYDLLLPPHISPCRVCRRHIQQAKVIRQCEVERSVFCVIVAAAKPGQQVKADLTVEKQRVYTALLQKQKVGERQPKQGNECEIAKQLMGNQLNGE